MTTVVQTFYRTISRAKTTLSTTDAPPAQSTWIGPIVAVVMGLLLAYDGYESLLLRQRLAQEGVDVRATVVEARSFRHRFGSRFTVTVTYPAQGTAVTRQLGVQEYLFRQITSNGVVTPESLLVRYAASDPDVAMVAIGSQHEGNGKLVIGALFTVGALMCAAYRSVRLAASSSAIARRPRAS